MAKVARVGHRILILCRAADLFKELKTFEASMSETASLSSVSNILRMA